MASKMAALCLAVAVLAVFTSGAAAEANFLGKGKSLPVFSKGSSYNKGSSAIVVEKPSISFTTSCENVCTEKCTVTPKQSCQQVQVPYQDCKQVAVSSTKKECKNVCTTETPVVSEPVYSKGSSYGKGSGFSKSIVLGKGRHLLGLSKGLPIISLGKGKASYGKTSCNQVCKDVPFTSYETKCETKSKTENKCSISLEKSCSPSCAQVCKKVPVVTKEKVVVAVSKHHGHGKGLSLGKGFDLGKGH